MNTSVFCCFPSLIRHGSLKLSLNGQFILSNRAFSLRISFTTIIIISQDLNESWFRGFATLRFPSPPSLSHATSVYLALSLPSSSLYLPSSLQSRSLSASFPISSSYFHLLGGRPLRKESSTVGALPLFSALFPSYPIHFPPFLIFSMRSMADPLPFSVVHFPSHRQSIIPKITKAARSFPKQSTNYLLNFPYVM